MTSCNCGKSFKNQDAFEQHRTATKHVCCRDCERGFEKQVMICSKSYRRWKNWTWHCNYCEVPFSDSFGIYNHQRSTGHCYCSPCDRFFCCNGALDEHNDDLHEGFHFERCNSGGNWSKTLRQHQSLTGHCICEVCCRPFSSKSFLEKHMRVEHEWICRTCSKQYKHYEYLRTHQASAGHCYCRECDRFFGTDADLRAHKHDFHASHFRCCDCDQDFRSEQALTQHLANKVHQPIEREALSYPCAQCGREFGNERTLRQHQASGVHKPLSDIPCLDVNGSQGPCKRRFASPSALLHHLESGTCSSGWTREKLNDAVEANDVGHIISDAQAALLASLQNIEVLSEAESSTGVLTPAARSGAGVAFTESSDDENTLRKSPILTPRSSQSNLTLGWTVAENLICPCCPSRRHFRSKAAFWQHLNSPAHLPLRFHCPLGLFDSSRGKSSNGGGPPRSFSTLSGLAQHVESGACRDGKAMLKMATRYIEDRLKAMGLGEVKLLKED